ncbi:hypothetical protein B0H63DRAFT_181249 [Podospora didyma]|uniref:DUF1857-domain-containing protein n=1 Tax=Podospora didyma TaxID=330526 RepID=A0AAE0NPR6_9PEZI|nr:hypothetical protein B0H63DRAFT_181249 [Podospora didyma]
MAVINYAYTAPVNRPGQPTLTHAQVWAGLECKVRHGDEFVPAIAECTVISDETTKNANETIVTRDILLNPGNGLNSNATKRLSLREVCTQLAPYRIDFVMENGTMITNSVSSGAEPSELYLTSLFSWRHPDVKDGSAEVEALAAKHEATAKAAVETTLVTMRRLVSEGKINA